MHTYLFNYDEALGDTTGNFWVINGVKHRGENLTEVSFDGDVEDIDDFYNATEYTLGFYLGVPGEYDEVTVQKSDCDYSFMEALTLWCFPD